MSGEDEKMKQAYSTLSKAASTLTSDLAKDKKSRCKFTKSNLDSFLAKKSYQEKGNYSEDLAIPPLTQVSVGPLPISMKKNQLQAFFQKNDVNVEDISFKTYEEEEEDYDESNVFAIVTCASHEDLMKAHDLNGQRLGVTPIFIGPVKNNFVPVMVSGLIKRPIIQKPNLELLLQALLEDYIIIEKMYIPQDDQYLKSVAFLRATLKEGRKAEDLYGIEVEAGSVLSCLGSDIKVVFFNPTEELEEFL